MSELVSCLCVTRGPYLANALRQFRAQTHARRELVVVHQGLSASALAEARALGAILVDAPRSARLGALRQLAIEAATGPWAIQWDDDDLFHPDRIARQLAFAVERAHDVVFLSRWHMRTLAKPLEIYRSFPRLWEGSMLARRASLLREGYDFTMALAEDSAICRALCLRAKATGPEQIGVMNAPELYLYQHTGRNSWPLGHFAGMMHRSELLLPMAATAVLEAFPAWQNESA